ncbi:MAG: SDR family NAD(P)-dependent oxidoreductase [Chloroflexota bacterium]
MSTLQPNEAQDGVALIGLAGRFPQARNVEEFWKNLCQGIEALSPLSEQDLAALPFPKALGDNPKYVKAGYFLDDVDLFDAAFFGYTPREAELMDPQQRIFLECAWEALERAGYTTESYQFPIGIFAGVGPNVYFLENLLASAMEADDGAGSIGSDKDYITTRTAYKLNLRGPSITVQTACSTSLVAVSLACQSLINYQCDLVLAGGVSFSPYRSGYLAQEEGFLSPDGHCRAFDAKAGGFVGGDGAGIVVLKRLDEAIRDGDMIYASIKGWAVNNDGAAKVGFTAPSVEAQAEVISLAQALADIEADTITYVETHGTGTPLGDPIEIAALTQAFRTQTDKKGFCAIGSVKTNIGHLDAAAGVAGLIKTALALYHRQIPPSLNYEQPNPKIDFASSPFFVNTQLADWPAGPHPRRAGVSSFGMGGTNAHVVLEEAPPQGPSSASRPWQLIPLSAKTPAALEQAAANLAEHLEQHPELNLADVAYTLKVGRRGFSERRFVIGRSIPEVITGLRGPCTPDSSLAALEDRNSPVVFLFPGQGAQHVSMAQGLYASEPIFRQHLDACAQILQPDLGSDLRSLLFPPQDQQADSARTLQQTAYAQPALFAVEYALAQLWLAWGIQPQAMLGHSLGEYVAACLAGVFSLPDALRLVAARGRLMQSLPAGSMLAVSLPEEQIQLPHGLSIAAINAPTQCVVSGPGQRIQAYQAELTQQGIDSQALATSHAFHSEMMEPILAAFVREVAQTPRQAPQVPFVSNLTGSWITPEAAMDATYWGQHLRQTVRFWAGLETLLEGGERVALEVGPGKSLSSLARQQGQARAGIASLRHAKEGRTDEAVLLDAVGKLWLNGVTIDWAGYYAQEQRRRLVIPTYPFERRRYWIERTPNTHKVPDLRVQEGKQPDLADWFYLPYWKPSVLPQRPRYVDRVSHWLIFCDACGLSDSLKAHLVQQGQAAICVLPGERFARTDSDTYQINPGQETDYAALIQDLRSQKRIPDRIIHCWSVDRAETDSSWANFNSDQSQGWKSLLYLARALGNQNVTHPLSLWIVSNLLQTVTGEEPISPEKATLLAPCKIIPQEYPNITCCSVDVRLPVEPFGFLDKLSTQLVCEFVQGSHHPCVAYRGNTRWVQDFEAVKLEGNPTSLGMLRQKGVYLITGGLGNLGLILADGLAQSTQARLVLVARSTFPPPDTWAAWLATHPETDPTSHKIRKIQSIEAQGAEVLIAQADVSNLIEMQVVRQQAEQRFGKINGVIHAAGRVDEAIFRMIQESTPDDWSQSFPAKVGGLFVLDELFQEQKLDFCLLMSSLASVLGGLGYGEYAAGNLFMDAFAYWQQGRRATPWISVNWDAWSTEEDTLHPELSMTPGQGFEVFRRILLTGPFPQVVVSTGDLRTRLEKWIRKSDLKRDSKPVAAPATRHPRPALQTEFLAPRDDVEQVIADIWQEMLGLAPIGVYDNFFELGGHSLLATQIVARLQQAFRMNVPLRELFESPNIAGIGAALENHEPKPGQVKTIARLRIQTKTMPADEVRAMLQKKKENLGE